MMEFYLVCRTNDHDVVLYGKEGPRLYATERNAVKQAEIHNEQDWKWGAEYPDTPHLQEYKQYGDWMVRKVTF